MGLRELARRVGCDRGYLSRLERGLIRTPDRDVVKRIARALAVPLEAIDPPNRGEDVTPQALPAPPTVAPLDPLKRYTPEEVAASGYLPWTARVIREKCYKRELYFHKDGGRISMTADDILRNTQLGAVEPFAPAATRKPAA